MRLFRRNEKIRMFRKKWIWNTLGKNNANTLGKTIYGKYLGIMRRNRNYFLYIYYIK